MEIERRVLAGDLEVREVEGKPVMLAGYAAVFGQRSELIGGTFREVIRQGTFKRAMEQKQDVRALVDHDIARILGRVSAGTLRLQEDTHGLHFEVDLPDTSYSNDLIQSVRRKDITGASFGFRTVEDKWVEVEGVVIRELRDVDLFEVSPVTFPAYPQTEVAVRAYERFAASRSPMLAAMDREIDLLEME